MRSLRVLLVILLSNLIFLQSCIANRFLVGPQAMEPGAKDGENRHQVLDKLLLRRERFHIDNH